MPILHYQALHRIPELDRCTPKTLSYLQQNLQGFSLSFPENGSLCAFWDAGKGKTLAFRAELDGLPIREETGLAFASRHEGRMHACGHDGHMAILLSLAAQLQGSGAIPYNILLIFQAAEETTGGAKELCDSGILEAYRVSAVFGLHIWPGLPAGEIFSRKGPMMAAATQISAVFSAPGGHIAAPGQGALGPAMEFYRRVIQEAPSFFVKFGQISGGEAANIQAWSVALSGCARALQADVLGSLKRQLEVQARRTQQRFACEAALTFSDGYPALVNDPALLGQIQAAVPFRQLSEPVLQTDDFGYYGRYCPACFFFLGAGEGPGLHRPDFSFPAEILQKGVDFFRQIITKIKLSS